MLEAIAICEEISRQQDDMGIRRQANRIGDHIWWISDISKFQAHYPGYELRFDSRAILREIHEKNHERWRGLSRRVAHA